MMFVYSKSPFYHLVLVSLLVVMPIASEGVEPLPGAKARNLLKEIQEETQQLLFQSPGVKKEFITSVSLMNHIQRIVSPLRYSVLAGAGEKMPTTVEQCLESRAGICGNQVACFLLLANQLELRARSVEFYLHGEQPRENTSHIGVEVYFSGGWKFFDVTWGTYFQNRDDICSIAEVRKNRVQARDWAVTNQTDQWYLHWRRAGLDPLIYVDHTNLDMLRGRLGSIRLFPVESVYRPIHQPGFVGLNTLDQDYGDVSVILNSIPTDKTNLKMTISGKAGGGHLLIIQGNDRLRVSIASLNPGTHSFELPFQLKAGEVRITLEEENPRQIGYVVYTAIKFE